MNSLEGLVRGASSPPPIARSAWDARGRRPRRAGSTAAPRCWRRRRRANRRGSRRGWSLGWPIWRSRSSRPGRSPCAHDARMSQSPYLATPHLKRRGCAVIARQRQQRQIAAIARPVDAQTVAVHPVQSGQVVGGRQHVVAVHDAPVAVQRLLVRQSVAGAAAVVRRRARRSPWPPATASPCRSSGRARRSARRGDRRRPRRACRRMQPTGRNSKAGMLASPLLG